MNIFRMAKIWKRGLLLTVGILLQLRVPMETEVEDVHMPYLGQLHPWQLVVGQVKGTQGHEPRQALQTFDLHNNPLNQCDHSYKGK